jgi:hypothetical protein
VKPLRILTGTEQVAACLREAVGEGRWTGTMPGSKNLAAELGVNAKTVEAALLQLEQEGILASRGRRLGRGIVSHGEPAKTPLRVALLVLDAVDRGADYMIELRHLLQANGHTPFDPDKTLLELGMETGRVERFVKKTRADAWVVGSASHEVLEWFSAQETPAFALFGRMAGLPLAGTRPDKATSLAAATRCLRGHGHRRISFLCRRHLRLPQPGITARAFLGALEVSGVSTGAFNLPDWEESREGFERILDSLFRITPPTALILDEPFLYHAAVQFLMKRRLRVPEDVSLICTDADPGFAWCQSPVSHIRWEFRPVLRRIVRWANNIARGRDDRRQTLTKAQFVEGGTVGPAAS